GRLPQGLFLGQEGACPGSSGFCGQPIGLAAPAIITAQQAYQAAVLAAGPSSNGTYIGNILAAGIDTTGTQLFAPNYKTARSVQMNIGVQREIRRGMVLTVDYLRNIATHNLLSVDTNHLGAASFRGTPLMNLAAAQNAISATNNQFGCGTGFDQASTQCAITAGATIVSYAGNG